MSNITIPEFLRRLTYADIYQRVPSHGDGNAKDSPSDRQVLELRKQLWELAERLDKEKSK